MERNASIFTQADRIISFLETDTVFVTFTPRGLKHLSLRAGSPYQRVDLGLIIKSRELSSAERLLIQETFRFMETGKHRMPLDLSGFTDFQQRVFAAVSAVEPGQTTTYKGIAESLGKPGGAQAVGNAIAKNPVAYFLPTHRVLPQKGIGICRSGAGHLREKLLSHEGHDLSQLRGNYVCTRKKCCLE